MEISINWQELDTKYATKTDASIVRMQIIIIIIDE